MKFLPLPVQVLLPHRSTTSQPAGSASGILKRVSCSHGGRGHRPAPGSVLPSMPEFLHLTKGGVEAHLGSKGLRVGKILNRVDGGK